MRTSLMAAALLFAGAAHADDLAPGATDAHAPLTQMQDPSAYQPGTASSGAAIAMSPQMVLNRIHAINQMEIHAGKMAKGSKTVAMKAAADHPDLFGAVVAVDGFPCLFAVIDPATTADAMRKAGEAERAKLERATKEEFLKAQRNLLTPMLDADRLEGVMRWQADSDRLTIAKAKGEYFALDLRPEVPKVAAPILVLAAYNPAVYDRFQVSKAAFEERVKAQVAKAKAATVAVHGDCKHFIMYERPDWMWTEMDRFLPR